MLLITVILSLAASTTAETWLGKNSAASDAQIRFAIENKYDGTGPGAQAPEYAYKTYQTLDEALVAYVNDPDTQLPQYEKDIALHKLTHPTYNTVVPEPIPRYRPKTVDEYTGYKPPQTKGPHNPAQEYAGYKLQNVIKPSNIGTDYTGWKPTQGLNPREPVNHLPYYKHTPTTDPSLSGYTKHYSKFGFDAISNADRPIVNANSLAQNDQSEQEEFEPNPQYSFSYGVHDKGTGDSKSAHETHDGTTVRGYYTFIDADGKQRTVHYTADDKLGFRATVQRTQINTQ